MSIVILLAYIIDVSLNLENLLRSILKLLKTGENMGTDFQCRWIA